MRSTLTPCWVIEAKALARGRDHEQLLSDRLRGALQLMQFFQRIRAVWMSEQRNHADIRH
jgi:hypothetical protein